MHQSLKEQRLEQAVKGLLQPDRREADALAHTNGESAAALFPLNKNASEIVI